MQPAPTTPPPPPEPPRITRGEPQPRPTRQPHPRRIPFATLAFLLLSVWLFTGCASVARSPSPRIEARLTRDTAALTHSLRQLSPELDAEECARLASGVVSRARELAMEYRSLSSPLLHNSLVNLGWRQRGLCFQWADDLEGLILAMNLRTVRLQKCIARRGSYREHNALVVTAPGQAFRDGLVLDAWRHAGFLYWGRVGDDRYPWEPDPSP